MHWLSVQTITWCGLKAAAETLTISRRDQRGFGALIGQQSKVQEVDGESKVDASLLRLQIQINGRKIQIDF